MKSNIAVILVSLTTLFYASLVLAQRRAVRVLPAEAQQAASLERAVSVRNLSHVPTNTVTNYVAAERWSMATNRAEVARSRMGFDDRALLRDGISPTNDATLIRSARWKIISVQSVTNRMY